MISQEAVQESPSLGDRLLGSILEFTRGRAQRDGMTLLLVRKGVTG